MAVTQRRLTETLDRVTDPMLRDLIRGCIGVLSSKPTAQNTPWKEYQDVITVSAEHPNLPPEIGFVPLEDSELRRIAEDSTSRDDRSSYRDIVRLDKLTIKNFGSYVDQANIDLNPVGERNVTVVVGSNGNGKSTLFNAINWALFGDDFLVDLARSQQKERRDLVSHAALRQLDAGLNSVETEVILWFSIAGIKYYARRKFSTVLLNGEYSPGVVATSVFKVQASGNHEPLPEDSLRQLLSGLPKNVKDFYLFDGERINLFAAPGSQRAVKDAISRIVGVKELEKVAKHLDELAGKLRNQHKHASKGSAAEAVDAYERHIAEVARKQAEVEALRESITDLAAMKADLNRKLRDAPQSKMLQQRREQLLRELSEVEKSQEEHGQALRNSLSTVAGSLALPAIAAMAAEIDSNRGSGEIPSHIRQQLLEDLLASAECICGTGLGEGTDARAHIERELEQVTGAIATNDAMLELFYKLRLPERLIEDARSRVRSHDVAYWQQRDRQDQIQEALSGVSIDLEGLEFVDIASWEAELTSKSAALDMAKTNLVGLEGELELSTRQTKVLQAEVDKREEQEATAHELHRMHRWAEAGAEALSLIIREFAAIARIEVERRTEQLWHKLLPNTIGYKVQVSDDFELSVLSPAGTSGITHLAMGQQQCLGLAFITAVAQVSETKPPLVIDMPFGRLAEVVAAEVARALPGLTSQLILFVLPTTEWNSQIQAALDGSIARVITLTKNDTESPTQISVQAS